MTKQRQVEPRRRTSLTCRRSVLYGALPLMVLASGLVLQMQRQPTCAPQAHLVPGCGALFGAYTLAGDDPHDAVLDLEARIERKLDLTLRYHDFSTDGPGIFPDRFEQRLGRDRALMVAWESRSYRSGADLAWADIARGDLDDVVRSAARRVRAYGRPLLISFDPEMDRLLSSKGTPAEYVAAARHVRGVFLEEGATNASWAWVTTGYLAEGGAQNIRAAYPGDEHVDWVGYDPYNFFRCRDTEWETFEESIAPAYQWLEQNGFADKPFILGEYGTQFDPQDPQRSREWYLDMPDVLRRYPNVKAIVRWDSDFDCGLQLDNGPGMLDAFAEAGRDPWFNHGAQAADDR